MKEMEKEPTQTTLESYNIGSLQNIKVAVNRIMTCSCQSTQSVLGFINYCGKESRVDTNLLDEIHCEWVKKIKEVLTEVNFTSINIGIASIIDIECLRCCKLERLEPQTSQYAHRNMKETSYLKK